jgi:hypothetical protein
MTTHIFLALGMWPEVIAQNIVAAGPHRNRWTAGHYTYWLHYGLLQAGRIDEAVELLNALRAQQQGDDSPRQRMHLAFARAQQVVTGERWSDAALEWPLEFPPRFAIPASVDAFARGYAAVRAADLAGAEARLTELRSIARTDTAVQLPRLLADQLAATVTRARGDARAAERQLREVAASAAALPVEFGPPDFVKPPYEQLGEWLLQTDDRATPVRRSKPRLPSCRAGCSPSEDLHRRSPHSARPPRDTETAARCVRPAIASSPAACLATHIQSGAGSELPSSREVTLSGVQS